MSLESLKFDKVTAEYNRATILLGKEKADKARIILEKCLKECVCKEILVNLGNCYRLLGYDLKAIECYSRALQDNVPSNEETSRGHALNNLGLMYYSKGDDKNALKYYTIAIKENPKFWEAWWNCSTCVLRTASSGSIHQFPKGWEMYNSRFLKNPPVKLQNNKANLKYWIPGERAEAIYVLTEQGIGDSFMFGRYLSRLKEFTNKIYVQCNPTLNSVFSDYECSGDAIHTDAEVAYPICSLGHAFPNEIPPGDWLRGKFETRKFSEGFNVGIVWSGSNTHSNDRYRSINIHRFHRLAKYCNLWALSPDFSGNKHVRSLGIKTWDDTAAAINGLDLVIGVDTSVMHMCGSLGHEGWLLQPMKETDFRWGNKVDKSVWYKDIRIFENPCNWDVVFDNVEKALMERISEKC